VEKKLANYETLLIVASNLTLAEVQATSAAKMPHIETYPNISPDEFVWRMFNRQLSRLEEKLATQEEKP
jgi:hypothetical protein